MCNGLLLRAVTDECSSVMAEDWDMINQGILLFIQIYEFVCVPYAA